MVGEQLVHPVVGTAGDRAVGRQQHGIRQGEHPVQRNQVVAQRQRVPGRLEADGRGDVRQDVIAREHDLRGGVVEDGMTDGVTRCMHRPQRAGAQVELGAVDQPAVGLVPFREAGMPGPFVPAGRGYLGGQLIRAQLVQQVPAEHQVGTGTGHLVHRSNVGPLALPQADHVVQGLPELDREGVVVGVNVGDEEIADIAELIADLRQPGHEPLPGLDQGDAAVDEVDALVIGDRVDVDRPQRVHGQRQGDPVHAPAEVLDPRLGPCVPVRRGHAHCEMAPSCTAHGAGA